MRNLQVFEEVLEDGSKLYEVQFLALHSDNSRVIVKLAAFNRVHAYAILEALEEGVSYAESDAYDDTPKKETQA